MFITNNIISFPTNKAKKFKKKSITYTNAMIIELLHYGIAVSLETRNHLYLMKPANCHEYCNSILNNYTIGSLTPPLFSNWEDRKAFTLKDITIQFGEYHQLIDRESFATEAYMEELLLSVDVKTTATLQTVEGRDQQIFLQANIGLRTSRGSIDAIAASVDSLPAQKWIPSADLRIMYMLSQETGLLSTKGAAPDVMRYFAGRHDTDSIILPSGVMFDAMSWQDRKKAMTFLDTFRLESLLDAMGQNRQAWNRFFRHIHIFGQSSYKLKYPKVVAAAWVSVSKPIVSLPESCQSLIRPLIGKSIDVTKADTLVYRTFMSRLNTALRDKNITLLLALISERPGVIFRNLTLVSNNMEPHADMIVTALQHNISKVSVSILLSLAQINPDAEYRIVDVKGTTVVTPANQGALVSIVGIYARQELRSRYGVSGKITVSKKLRQQVPPFLDRNTTIARGTKIDVDQKETPYIHFFMKWIQTPNRTTDLDHSWVIIHESGKVETVAFYNSANGFISQSGDIVSAPAPHGATEYSKLEISKIPNSVEYIVPAINVYSGDNFDKLPLAESGFMLTDKREFSYTTDRVRYKLTQPSELNVPFVYDVKNQQIIILDYNSTKNTDTSQLAIGSLQTLQQLIQASLSLNKFTIQDVADLLSSDNSSGDNIHITTSPNKIGDITPSEMGILFK